MNAPSTQATDGVTILPSADYLAQMDELARLRTANAALNEALKEARRAIGDHIVPDHCYATGPMTGDEVRDLVQCPACSFIAMHDAALASVEKP